MLEEEDYEKLVCEEGAYLLAGLKELKSRFPGIIGDVDGLGWRCASRFAARTARLRTAT